jgi:hypothetical protein
MKRLIPIVVVVGLLAAVGIRAFLDPVPMGRLQRLRKGMTKDEVRQLLGEPTKDYGSSQWTYQRPFVFGFVNIHWQADGTYDGEYNYERF